MSSLYQKHRPQTFSQVSGQIFTIKTLANSIKHDRIGHAYLFTGPRGTGKTTLARVFAKAINCLEPKNISGEIAIEPCNKCANCQLINQNRALDLIEIDAASHTGVDNIRALKEAIALPPSQLKYKVYIIDEVHMLSLGAFNALLKTLEEPPAHAVFILATTEQHKVPETIISRCQQFSITPLTQKQIIKRLQEISQKEGVEIENEALEVIAINADGGMRDAESMLTQIMSLEDKNITVEEVNSILGTSSKQNVIEFVQFLINQELAPALAKIDFLQTSGIDLKNFNKSLLAYLRNLMLIKSCPENPSDITTGLTEDQIIQAQELIKETELKSILRLIELFQKSLEQFKITNLPSLPLELATIDFLTTEDELSRKKTIQNEVSKLSQQKIPPQSSPTKTNDKKTIATSLKKKPKPEKRELTSSEDEQKIANKKESTEPILQKSIKLSEVLDEWSTVLENVRPLNHSIHAFLKNCIPIGILEDNLYIKTKYDFYKDKLDEIENKLTVQQVIAKITNAPLKIVFVNEQEAEKLKFEPERLDENPLHAAMKLMGGRIVES
ncbi:MAG TPA: DNA polymerase III subunit gamma/tau [Candidatus Moranbacteria bacterium]|nr:DNA polymerase III subunit gamma/tau [Candidatus Moranbacteria bacterium]